MTKKLLEESTVNRWKELAGINEGYGYYGRNNPRYGKNVRVATGPMNLVPNEQEKQQIEQIKNMMFDSLLPLAIRVASAWSPAAAKNMSKAKEMVLSRFPETETYFTRQEQGKITLPDNAGFLFLKKFVEMSGLPFDHALGYIDDEQSVRQEAGQIAATVKSQLENSSL